MLMGMVRARHHADSVVLIRTWHLRVVQLVDNLIKSVLRYCYSEDYVLPVAVLGRFSNVAY